MKIFFTAIGLGAWTLLICSMYLLSEGIIDWGTSSTGSIVETGRQIVGDEASRYLDTLNVENIAQKGLGIMQGMLVPLLVILWLIGAVIIVAIPWLVVRIAGIFRAKTMR